MPQNQFFGSSDSQTFMSHSFIPAIIYGLKVVACYTISSLVPTHTNIHTYTHAHTALPHSAL